MKKTIIVMIIFVVLLTNSLLSQGKQVKGTAEAANIYADTNVDSYLMKTVKKGTILYFYSLWKKNSERINISYRSEEDGESITLQPEFPDIKKKKKFTFLVRVDYFSPTEKLFKEIYGSGINYGGEIKASLWKGISIYFGASVFSKKGEMTLFGEETKINIIPIELGVLYKFSKTKINPYIGAGLGYHILSEESFLGKVTANNVGYFGQLGVAINLIKAFVIDINAKYNFCDVKIGEIKKNIGGIRIGMGIGFCF